MKICLQGAAFDTGNMGVNALAVGTVRCILHSYPQAEVFFLNYEKFSTVYTLDFPDRQVAVPLVNMRFSWRFWLRNNIAYLLFLTVLMKLLPIPALRRRWIAAHDCLRHLEESDVVVAISGGDSFSDIYGARRLLYVSLPQILALWAGKRLVLLPQTLGPFNSRYSRVIARYIMKRAQVVYSRDQAGVMLATEMLKRGVRGQELGVGGQVSGDWEKDFRFQIQDSRYTKSESRTPNPESLTPRPESRIPNPESLTPDPQPLIPNPESLTPGTSVRFCYDVGFVVDAIPPSRLDVAGLSLTSNPEFRVPCPGALVGLNVSGLLSMGGYSGKNMFGLKMDYRTFIDSLIGFLIEKKHADVVLIPHVLGTGGECDSPVCEKVYEALKTRHQGHLGVVRGLYNQSEIKYLIGLCDFFIGARMHACIAALSQCVPAVAIAYSDKFIGVMQTVGVGGLVADPRTMDEEQILNAIGDAYDHRADLRRQLERTIPSVKQTVLRLFEDIADATGNPQERAAAARRECVGARTAAGRKG